MHKNTIAKLVQSFLKTYGYNSKSTGVDDSLLFSRPTGMGVSDEALVYFHEKGEEAYIDTRLKRLKEKYNRVPDGEEGKRFFLSSAPLGLVPDGVKKNGFKYQVPVWFFDREFSSEKRTTPLKQIEKSVTKYERERIEQPYKVEGEVKNTDLLEDLLKELEEPHRACLRIIIAPAGYGKSVLMETLYAKLKNVFLNKKQTQKISKRPLLMLPGHLKQSKDLDGLVNNFIGEEYDYGVSNKNTFMFMVKNNFATWLLDGLEELMVRIPEELIYILLEDYIAAADADLPQIIIAIRKPVLATLPELKETLEDYADWIKVYELCDWGKEQKIAYFKKNLTTTQRETQNFITDLTKTPLLNNLCNVPYYCKLISDLQNNNEMATFKDDCDLVEHAFNKLCEREFAKGLDKDSLNVSVQREIFSDKDLIETVLQENKISKSILAELGDLYLNGLVNKEVQLGYLYRHAILTQSGEDLAFIQDIIKQYLIAMCFSKSLSSDPSDLKLFDYTDIELDSFLIRYLVKNLSHVNWDKIKNRMSEFRFHPEKTVAFCNIMKIFLQTDTDKKELFIKDMLQNCNLVGLTFRNLDMSGFKFQNSHLASVKFENCNLSKINFNGCNIKDTSFDSACDLSQATTKGASIESIINGVKSYYDKKQIEEYLYKRTKIAPESHEPCQAVINIKRVIEKLVKKGKGYKIPKKRLINTKCGGGITAYHCTEALIRHRVLSEEGDFVRIRINLFDNIKSFIVKQTAETTPPILHKVLDDVCVDKRLGCQHICKES